MPTLHFLCFNNSRIKGEDLVPVNAFKPPPYPPVALDTVSSKAVVLLLLTRCWVLLPLWDSVIVLLFVVRSFVSIILVLLSSR